MLVSAVVVACFSSFVSSSDDDDAETTTTRVGQRFRCSCYRCCRVENDANDVTPLKLTDDAILFYEYVRSPAREGVTKITRVI